MTPEEIVDKRVSIAIAALKAIKNIRTKGLGDFMFPEQAISIASRALDDIINVRVTALAASLPAATTDEDIEDANFEAAVTSFENNYKDQKDYQWDHDSYVAGFEDGMAHRGARAALAASVPATDLERKNELLIQTIESLRAASVPQAAPEPKLGFREWLCQGGAGHEDGEDGIRACTLPLNSAIEMVDDYLEYLRG